ncbi:MAG: hypothetical protein ACSHYB_09195 [Roseibacillus sp.]
MTWLLGLTVSSAESERIAGTQASIAPPEGVEVATQFPGFIDKESGSSIMVTVIPGPYAEVTGGFTEENMALRQMELLQKKERKQGDLEGTLIHLSQTAGQGTEYLKWIWIFGNDKESVFVTATFPKEEGEEFSKKMRASVESTTWDANLKVDPFEGLTFRIEEAGKFRIAKVVGNMIILTEDAVFPTPELTAPFVIVGASLSENWEGPEDLIAFGSQRVKQTQEFQECEIESSEEWAQAGMAGVMTKATGGGADGERFVQQGLLFSEDGYYILQAFCQEDARAEHKDSIQKIFDSFETVQAK